ncbi:MAG: PDZ domain-containing protein [Deltaproteobacteria bacterium]|uniref:PDZ domain-containing protein n=1 Tax=Candidatus Zymogenus saltonus TaxID=2844893 RepID=A0A9D8KG84_9DELT|nr:PDZ domain-containing protein [Candidatus Zymogenus saltonus]
MKSMRIFALLGIISILVLSPVYVASKTKTVSGIITSVEAGSGSVGTTIKINIGSNKKIKEGDLGWVTKGDEAIAYIKIISIHGNSAVAVVTVHQHIEKITSGLSVHFKVDIHDPKPKPKPDTKAELITKLGFTVENVTDSIAKYLGLPDTNGVIITHVKSGSIGSRLGLKKGFIIQKLNDSKIRNTADLKQAIKKVEKTGNYRFSIWHDGHSVTFVYNDLEKVKKDLDDEGYIGVVVQKINTEIAMSLKMENPRGVLISGIEPGSPADNVDLIECDVIIKYNDIEVNEPSDLVRLASNSKIGERVYITIIRHGKEKVVSLKMANRKWYLGSSKSKKGFLGVDCKVIYSDPFGPFTKSGSIRFEITGIFPGSPADNVNLQRGDIIYKFNNKKIESSDDFKTLVANTKVGEGVVVNILREGKKVDIYVKIGRKPE